MISTPAALAFAALFAFLLIVRLAAHLFGVSFYVVGADIVSVADLPSYVGIVSQLGLGLWTAAVAVATMAWALLRGRGPASGFFAHTALLGTAFLVDDALLAHEAIAPTFGIPEEVVLAALGLAAVAWAVRHRAVIGQSAFGPLLVAVAFGAASVLLDMAGPYVGSLPEHGLLEEGTKLIGIGGWLIFVSGEAYRTLARPSAGEHG
jgi:hypothetical protein